VGDLLGPHQLHQWFPRDQFFPGGDDERRAGAEGHHQLEHGRVEDRRRRQEHAVAGPDRQRLGMLGDHVRQATVLDHHPLGSARRTRRVDDVRRFPGVDDRPRRARVAGTGRLAGLARAWKDAPVPGRGQFGAAGVVRHDDRDRRVAQQQLSPGQRLLGVEGEEGGAGPGHGEQRGDQLRAGRQLDAHDRSGLDTRVQ
jgi:hypothetical protein